MLNLLFAQPSVFAQSDEDQSIVTAAVSLIDPGIVYDPSYFAIDYPMGDVPEGKGVCTDVIIRAYRLMGIDLQELVHQDMKANFSQYPTIWGLQGPDRNIDHRRVPNLLTYFKRFGEAKSITNSSDDYLPGDIVCWELGGGMTHIGIVIDSRSTDGKRNLIVHNIKHGQVAEDILFSFKIIGHYSYKP